MKAITFFVGLLLSAAPVAGQSRVYTNADLGKPLTSAARLDPAAAAAILAPHQFVALPAAPALGGAQVVVIGSPTAGPFGEFAPFPEPRRLDGSLYTERPWHVTTHAGWQASRFVPQLTQQRTVPAGPRRSSGVRQRR